MPETARPRQNRTEGLSGGAGNRCYGKYIEIAKESLPGKVDEYFIIINQLSSVFNC